MSLVIALLLDAIFGEPKWLWSRFPHPAVLIGQGIATAEQHMNRGPRKLMGIVMLTGLVLLSALVGFMITALPLGEVWGTILAAILLAQRSLADHVTAVARALRLSVADGRSSVAMIVGRDVRDMDEAAVSRAAIESAAENLSDGVVAPAFWFLVAGLPGIMVYKAINTADSMVGYRTARYAEFGWASARLDDLVNWLPARTTAILILLSRARPDLWGTVRRDAALHRSPNAGWPEAAMAMVLDIALSGPRSYDGSMQDFPYVNATGRHELGADDIEKCVRILWQSWSVLLAILFLAAIIL
jgi:adenosylcobinamide-phosphate synthase